MSCETCNVIGRTIQSNASFDGIPLGTYGEMQRRDDCQTCQQIVNFQPMPPETKMELMRFRQPASEYQITDEDYSDFIMDVIPLRPNAEGQSHGILVNQNWIDTARIKSWLHYCEGNHGDACRQLSSIPPVEKLLLLDVEQGCLVEMPGNVRYFALSYVWGLLPDTAETRLSNVRALKQPGSITADTTSLNIPETIRDALRLLRILDERFLWVDRLCIVQDDHATKARAIQEMGAIYANAQCTIVAAGGDDAAYGLRGIGHGSQPRSSPQTLLNLPHCGPVLQQQEVDVERRSRWGTRGWTYQEQLCSRRLLLFTDTAVAWRCQRAEWREDLSAEPDGVARPPLLDRDFNVLRVAKWPDIEQWSLLAHAYNRRQLSFVSDTCAAFAGIETIIAPSFPGGFCYGLPVFFFDVALLWQPMRPMARRAATHDPDGDGYLPSWSFFGWHGTPDPLSYVAGQDYIADVYDGSWGRRSTLKLVPLVKWFQMGPTGKDAESGQEQQGEAVQRPQRPIESGYLVWREAVPDAVTLADHGWSCQYGGDGASWYAHAAAEGVKFNYPVPMPPPAPQQGRTLPDPPPHTSWPPLLHFRCKGAHFLIGRAVLGLDMRQVLCVELRDLNSRLWAGVLRLNEPLDGSTFSAYGEKCELVAISEGSARNQSDESSYLEEWNLTSRPGFGNAEGYYIFYNVLWVHREADGIMTRKALGRVAKSVWDEQELMDMDVILR
ncbi:hypothetical protein SLS54_008268 [Diplodia seriata]